MFNAVNQLKQKLRQEGEDIIDLGMGNPDHATPSHIVDKLTEAARNPKNHRYSLSRGIYKLRLAICDWYKRKFDVDLDPECEAISTIGAKEGLSHLALAVVEPGDIAICPNPTYPIHTYCIILAGGNLRTVYLGPDSDFFEDLQEAIRTTWPRPKLLILSFPHNPTTAVVDLEFFQKVVDLARENKIMVIHDFAYADLVFDGYRAPSILEVKGAKDVAVEFFSMSKSYNMPGWRVGFCVGNTRMVNALTRIKSYLDYGIFQPLQIASVIALNGPTNCVDEIVEHYKGRRDALITGLNRIGWGVKPPKGPMFVWAQIPEEFQKMGSLEFSQFLVREAKVAVSPGIGFGEFGDKFVRFALVENTKRINQAIRGLKKVL